MYKGFNLSATTFGIFEDLFALHGTDLNKSNKDIVEKSLESFIGKDGVVDGSALQQRWFPKLDVDVFISHSHQDEKAALALAGWLSLKFKLKPFVDSCVWGYADHLLREIDDKYCRNKGGETYDYEKRNGSTSHVHMMLSTAIGMMIDSTECLIFLNTPHSITSEGAVDKTQSPWLFAELFMASTIQKTIPTRLQRISENFNTEQSQTKMASALEIHYRVTPAQFANISPTTLNQWLENYLSGGGHNHALDVLYKMTPKTEIEVLSE